VAGVVGDEHRADGQGMPGNHRVHAADPGTCAVQIGCDGGKVRRCCLVPRQTLHARQDLVDQLGQPRIAGATRTRGDLSVKDVRQEAWLVAADIEQRRGYPIDFGDPDDQC
jgi:hypothetical protein